VQKKSSWNPKPTIQKENEKTKELENVLGYEKTKNLKKTKKISRVWLWPCGGSSGLKSLHRRAHSPSTPFHPWRFWRVQSALVFATVECIWCGPCIYVRVLIKQCSLKHPESDFLKGHQVLLSFTICAWIYVTNVYTPNHTCKHSKHTYILARACSLACIHRYIFARMHTGIHACTHMRTYILKYRHIRVYTGKNLYLDLRRVSNCDYVKHVLYGMSMLWNGFLAWVIRKHTSKQ